MKMKYWLIGLLVCGIVVMVSCDGKKFLGSPSDEKNIDSLFLGISMGMDKKAFYDYCWEMNKQKVFMHGPTNQSVEYMLATQLNHPVSMEFYPNFYNEKIYEMPVLYSYEGWAPWNKEYSSDTLLLNLLPVYKKWYGEDFQKLEHPVQGTVYYQMKGKRRINLFIRDDQYVQAVFTDLKVEKEIKDKAQQESNTK
ncbi:MAG: hypothetical protein JJE09_08675 [Bacteroidia bacterium]|nr:hypothetical protein [Bacteroidia bacterium]